MELSTFVSETLKQVITGIKDAQAVAAGNGAKINPALDSSFGPETPWDRDSGTHIRDIAFDVAVTTTEGTATKGGAGVFVGAVGLGAQGQSTAQNTAVSRIQFTVPILMPVSK